MPHSVSRLSTFMPIEQELLFVMKRMCCIKMYIFLITLIINCVSCLLGLSQTS